MVKRMQDKIMTQKIAKKPIQNAAELNVWEQH